MSWMDQKYALLLLFVAIAVLTTLCIVFGLQTPTLTQTQLKSIIQTHLIFLGKLQAFEDPSNPQNRSTQNAQITTYCNIDIPLYYINLKRNPERNAAMIEQFQKHNVQNYTRIEAVNGKDDPTMPYVSGFSNKTAGELGCTLSHLRCAKTAYDANLPYVLIIEDDASLDLVPFWSSKLSEYIQNAPKDWTVLQLFSDYDYDKLPYQTVYHQPEQNTWSTVAYVINRQGMENLLQKTWDGQKFTLSKVNSENGDADYFIYQVSGVKTRYIVNLPLFIPMNIDSPSTIHDDHTTHHLSMAARILHLYTTRQLDQLTISPNLALFQSLAQPKVIYENSEPPTQLDIVLAYFQADLSWLINILSNLKRDQYRLIVYSKGKQDHTPFLPYVHKWIELENIGRCDHSYVYHILSRTTSSQNTLFVKDSANRHMTPDWILKHTNDTIVTGPMFLSPDPNLTFFSLSSWNQSHDQNKNADQFVRAPLSQNNFSRWAASVLNNPKFQVSDIKHMVFGGIFVCPSNFLNNTSPDNWTRIGTSISYAANVETGHYLERLWYHVLSTPNQ